jgi:hypothetical protein
MILTVDAAQIAPGKENIADPVRAADHGFLSFMHGDRGNLKVIAGSAESPAVFPFCIAGMGAQTAPGALGTGANWNGYICCLFCCLIHQQRTII